MAKFIPLNAGDIRGSAGATTFSKNRFGNYMRRRVSPVNPSTIAQNDQRNLVEYLSTYWATHLSDVERLSWATQASQKTLTDTLGQTYTMTGQNLFVGVNAVRTRAGAAIVDTAPGPGAMPALASIGGTVTADDAPASQAVSIKLTGTPAAGGYLQLWATAPMSAGRTFVKPSEYRLLKVVSSATIPATTSIKTEYLAKFGATPAAFVGLKVAFKCVPVDAQGYRGTPITGVTTVEAVVP